MKIKMIPTIKLPLLCTAMCAAVFAFSHNASALTIGDGHDLGLITHGNVGLNSRAALLNHLIGMTVGTSDTFNGESFNRSMNNNFGSLPTAVLGTTGSGTSVNLGTGLYSYLWAHYGGPGGGTVTVWYVGDLHGIITIPGNNGHDLSDWTLFGPTGTVPDGGTTVMLLGAALGALGMVRRALKI